MATPMLMVKASYGDHQHRHRTELAERTPPLLGDQFLEIAPVEQPGHDVDDRCAAQQDQLLDHRAQIFQQAALRRTQTARLPVGYRQHADHQAVGRAQRYAGVGRGGFQLTLLRPGDVQLVFMEVVDHQRPGGRHGDAFGRQQGRQRVPVETDQDFRQRLLLGDQRDRRDRHPECLRRDTGDTLERLVHVADDLSHLVDRVDPRRLLVQAGRLRTDPTIDPVARGVQVQPHVIVRRYRLHGPCCELFERHAP